MKLADWLHTRSVTPEQFRRMLGVRSRTTVQRYLTGERRPSPPLLQKIIELTEGAVQLEDFLDPAPPRCAAVVIDPDGHTRVVFPWASDTDRLTAAGQAAMAEPLEGTVWTPPLVRAMETLDPRVRFTKRGVFLLDGKPSDPRRIVRAANHILTAEGKPPIVYPGIETPNSESGNSAA